jgi:ribosomal protein S18 acetylase RimI-like enzyme
MEAVMVRLVPMTPADSMNLSSGTFSIAPGACSGGLLTNDLARSRKEHKTWLPDGLRSRYHHLYTIQETEQGRPVGVLWLRTDMDSSRASGHIFDLEIHEAFRRQGYGRQAMLELERLVREMGLRQLGLHVFAHNDGARALYEELGYRVASLNMLKDL